MKFFLLPLFLMAFSANAIERYSYQLVFDSVGVDDELTAVDYNAAIKILENRAASPDGEYIHNEFSTLCALYVMTKQLRAAATTCTTAVVTDKSHSAYNNRGVFRMNLRNISGALDDFAHARVLPERKQLYIQELMKSDVRLIADANYTEAIRHQEARKPFNLNQALSDRTKGADIEGLNQ